MATPKVAVRGTPTIPATMKAAAIDRFGPPSVLAVHTLPVPEPGPHEVLIALHAAGVGIWDARMRDGSWWPTRNPKFPIVLGTDGAGVVAARGARVRRFDVGERVWAYEYANPKGGFYAEYVAVNAEHVGPVPDALDLLEAGAAAVTALTALQGVDSHLRLRRGETVLIFGASGAVGTLALQFAKLRHACVIGAVRGRDAATLVRRLGADAVIDTRSDDAIQQLLGYAPGGLDAILAFAGGELLERCVDHLHPGGRVAYPDGVEPKPRARRGIHVMDYDAHASPREYARLARVVTAVRLHVPIAAAYSLAHVAKAHERVEHGHVLGRIVLRIRAANR